MEKIDILGMASPACSAVISALICSFHGVESASTDFASRQATVIYEYSTYTVDLTDSIAMAIEKAGYSVTCSNGVTIVYVSMRQIVSSPHDVDKLSHFFHSFDWVKRVHVNLLTSTVALFVKAHTAREELLSCLRDLGEGFHLSIASRDVHLEVEGRVGCGDSSGESCEGDFGSLVGSRAGAHRLYNALKLHALGSHRDHIDQSHSEPRTESLPINSPGVPVTTSAVLVNVSCSPPQVRIKGTSTVSELCSYLSSLGYSSHARTVSKSPLLPAVVTVQEEGVGGCLNPSMYADPLVSVHGHSLGGFLQIPEGDLDHPSTKISTNGGNVSPSPSVASSMDSIGNCSSSPMNLTPPRNLGATPLTWKANHNLSHLLIPSSPQSKDKSAPAQVASPGSGHASRHPPHRNLGTGHDCHSRISSNGGAKKTHHKRNVIQVGHTADLMATFTVEGGAEALSAGKIHIIEEEVRRQCLLSLSSPPTLPGSGSAGRGSAGLSVESVAAAVLDVRVHLFEETVEVLYDSSLLQWSHFVDSLSRAGCTSSLIQLRKLGAPRDLHTRRFLLSSNTKMEDIPGDLFAGGVSSLRCAGGVLGVRWVEDSAEVRRDIATLLQGKGSDVGSVLAEGSFAVLEVTYDSLVLPLFEVHERVVMSSSNRLHICPFPSELFVRRHDERSVCCHPMTAEGQIDMINSSGGNESDQMFSEKIDMDTRRDRLKHLISQCGISFALTVLLILLSVYNPLIRSPVADRKSLSLDSHDETERVVKIDAFELASFLLTTIIVYFPGATVFKDTWHTLQSWRGLKCSPYLLIGLGCGSAYSLGVMSLLSICIYLHIIDPLPSDQLMHFLSSLGLRVVHPEEYFLLTAIFTTCYLIAVVSSAWNEVKWNIPELPAERTTISAGGRGISSGEIDVDTVDLLVQSYLMLRPRSCVLLIVTSPECAGSTSSSLLGDLPYEVVREKEISSEVLKRGDLICVKRGEVIPVDGEVVRGIATVEEGLVTGDCISLDKRPADYVLGGSTVLECSQEGIHVLVSCEVEQSVLEQLLSVTLRKIHSKRGGSVAHKSPLATPGPSSLQSHQYTPCYQFFPIATSWSLTSVQLYNCFVLALALLLCVSWNVYGLLKSTVMRQSIQHFDFMLLGVHVVMSVSLTFSLLLLASPVMLGLLLANASVLYLSTKVAYARYGIGVQPARVLLGNITRLSSLVWPKHSLSEPHVEVTNVYMLSGYGAGRVMVRGRRMVGLDAIGKLSVEGCRPTHSYIRDSDLDGPSSACCLGVWEGNGHGSPRERHSDPDAESCWEADWDKNDVPEGDEFLSDDLVVFLAGCAQLPLQHERPLALAVTTHARAALPSDLEPTPPSSFELSPCGGIKCIISLPASLSSALPLPLHPTKAGPSAVEVVAGSLDFLRQERIRFSANSVFGNMANLSQETHGASVLFIAVCGQVSCMLQVQRRVLADAEITVRTFEARRVRSWMTSGESARSNASVGLEAGVSPLNVISGVYPQQVSRHISHLQDRDDEVVGYIMPGLDDTDSCLCAYSAGTGSQRMPDSRRNAFFLGKLLYGMPAALQADVIVCRRSASLPQHFSGHREIHPEIEIARKMMESAADLILLPRQQSFLSPRRKLSYSDATILRSVDACEHDTSPNRLFGLVAVMDLSETVDFLLRLITYTLLFGGLLWLLCVLVVLNRDATAVLRTALSSPLLSDYHISTVAHFLLLCWLPLHPPGTISGRAFSMYLLLLVCIIIAELVYVLACYTPPQRRAYLGLTKGNPTTEASSSPSPSPPSAATTNHTEPKSECSPLPPFADLQSVLSFTTSFSDARASSSPNYLATTESAPLLSPARIVRPSYGTRTAFNTSGLYTSLEMSGGEFDV